jgi:glycosyltransferase involved in cell wall biosynthesis
VKLLHLTNAYPPFSTGLVEKQCALLVRELTVRNHVNRVLTSDVTLPNIVDHDPQVNRRLRLTSTAGPRDFFRLLLAQRHNRRVLIEELEQLLPDLVVVWSMTGLPHSLLWELQRRRPRTVFAVLDGWPRHRLRDDPWYWWWAAPLPLDQKIFRRFLREMRLAPAILRAHPAHRPHSLRMRHGFFASRALRDSVRLAGYDVEGTEVLPYCLGRDELHAPPQRREDIRRLLWIGALDADHDPITAIQALQELRHQGEMRFSLDLFGRGDVTMESRIRDYVRGAQLAGAVTIRQVSVDEVALLYPSYDIFLHTARQPDAFPLVLVRAMAARVPIIATPEGSANDVVRNGQNALTFRTADPTDCAEKILRLATDRALIDSITERGYREVLDMYSAAVVGGRLDHLLHSAMQSAPEPGE